MIWVSDMTRTVKALRPTRRTASSARLRLGHAGRHPAGRVDRGAFGVRNHLIEEQTMNSTDSDMEQPFAHRPVMQDEVVDLFSAVPPGIVVDATVGGAGHSHALLSAHSHIRIVGLDQDPTAVKAARSRLSVFGDRAVVVHSRFDYLKPVVSSLAVEEGRIEEGSIEEISGVLFDLGVSSHQFDQPDRGFSYRFEAPLDMRMDPNSTTTAADLVNDLGETELAEILHTYGDERFSRRIAKAITTSRPIATTTELAEIVRGAIPAPARRTGGHPAKRTFQALRLVVNDELNVLPPALEAALSLLAPGGRCVVLAYHSGEDRIVKAHFRRAATGGCTCPQGLPCVCGAKPTVRLLKQGSRKPSSAEVKSNPRSKSVRLRAVEKIPIIEIPHSGGTR